MAVGTQKHSSKNDPLLFWNFMNATTWRGDMGKKLYFSR